MVVNWNKRTYTKEEFTISWNESLSISECARKLNLASYGSTYETLKKTALELNLTRDHMTGKGWNTNGYNPRIPIPLSEVMVENSDYSRGSLKKRLIEEKILDYLCDICGISNWLNSTLVLHLDHINGINNDNRLENLRLLCPNCHSQTSTYTGRNQSKKTVVKKTIPEKNKMKYYCTCGSEKSKMAKVCMSCRTQIQSSNIPSEEVLLEALNKHNWVYSKTCFDFNVSGNTIGKWVKRYNLTK